MMLVSLAEPGTMLILALALIGVFASLYHPSGLSLITRTMSRRGTALGINGIFGNIGIAGAPALTQLVANTWGWRTAYLSMGLLLLFLGLAVSFQKIEEPKSGEVSRDEHHHEPSERLKLFLILMVAMTMAGLTYRAITVAQPAYFDEQVQPVIALRYQTRCPGLLYWDFRSIRRRATRRPLRSAYPLPALSRFQFSFLAWYGDTLGGSLLGISAGLLFFILGMQPIENSLVARFTPDRWRSTGYGLKFTVTFENRLAFCLGCKEHYSLQLQSLPFTSPYPSPYSLLSLQPPPFSSPPKVAPS